jgi:hypothetical protein
MRLKAAKRSRTTLQRIRQEKILSRRRLIRARASGKKYAEGFCLAKNVDPEIFKRPLDFSQVETPPGYED